MSRLVIRDLDFAFPGRLPIFDKASLNIDLSEVITLSGANGSGKTTLCRMLSGLQPLPSGTVFFDGRDLATIPPSGRPFLHLRQEPRGNLVATTALEDLRLWVDGCSGKQSLPDKQLLEALDFFGLADKANRPTWLLSHGEARRAGLSALLLFPGKCWLLDEPYVGLEPRWRRQLQQLLGGHRSGALVVSHWVDEAVVGLRVSLSRGKFIIGADDATRAD